MTILLLLLFDPFLLVICSNNKSFSNCHNFATMRSVCKHMYAVYSYSNAKCDVGQLKFAHNSSVHVLILD